MLEKLRECKVGFRDKYLLDAITKINEGYFNNIKYLSEKEQEEKLISVKGIGMLSFLQIVGNIIQCTV